MGTTRRYLVALADTARAGYDWTQSVIAVVSLAGSILVGWKFGVAWGLSALLASLLAITTVTGWRLARDAGTRIPPGWNAIITGSQDRPGEWIPPGSEDPPAAVAPALAPGKPAHRHA